MKTKITSLAIIVISMITITTNAQLKVVSNAPSVAAFDVDAIIDSLPDGDRWIKHLNEDLLPFWTTKNALGHNGRFPTCRCNDGSVPKSIKSCPEFEYLNDDSRGLVKIDTLYTRAQSRQTYAYGVAYHMTGEAKYLKMMKAGVDFMRNNTIDIVNGGAYTYQNKNDDWGPKKEFRTSQDMAYALSGIGFYYYLTHDETVLQNIIDIKDYIFKTYYDPSINMLRWVLKDNGTDNTHQKELVSQLDQVYAYMLWLTPSLPEKYQTVWKQDLQNLAHIMITHFFSEQYHFFWGSVTDNKFVSSEAERTRRLGAPHTDFGHSIKTLWLIYQIGKLNNDVALLNFGKDNAANLINVAYVPSTGAWSRRFNANGTIDYEKEWWGLAELDQTTATLSLIDPSYAYYLTTTYPDWLEHLVDHENHEIWHMVTANNKPVLAFPKQHIWKNALHTFEHALVAYLTTQTLKTEKIVLHYAFKKEIDKDKLNPYFYMAKTLDMSKGEPTGVNGFYNYKVTFEDMW